MADDGVASGAFARDVYSFAHIPIVGGVILCAAALEEVALHPQEVLDIAFRWMFFAGIALSVVGVVLTIYRSYRVLARERIGAVAVLGVIVAVIGGEVSGLVLLIVIDIVVAALLAAEHLRVEHGGRIAPAKP